MTSFRWLLCIACLLFQLPCTADTPPLVLVSVGTYQDIVQQLAGDEIRVQSVVPIGASFHTYEPSPGHVMTMSTAKLWFTIGQSFETKMLNAFSSAGASVTAVDLRTGLALLHDHGGHDCAEETDSHIWTSPRMMKTQLVTIRKALEAAFPEKTQGIEERYNALEQQIDRLITTADEQLSGHQGKIIVIAHGAYGYLCHEYGIVQRALETGGKEATAKAVQNLLQEAKTRNVRTVFSLEQFSKRGISRIAEELHAQIVELDAYQSNYFVSMPYTIHAFQKALKEEDR